MAKVLRDFSTDISNKIAKQAALKSVACLRKEDFYGRKGIKIT